jgi:hypothetical protein
MTLALPLQCTYTKYMIDSGLEQNTFLDTETPDEIVLETTLRPSTLAEFVGQEGLKSNLNIVIQAAKQRVDRGGGCRDTRA